MRRRLLVAQVRIIPVSVWVIDGIGAFEHTTAVLCFASHGISPFGVLGSRTPCKLRGKFGSGVAVAFEFKESEFSMGNGEWMDAWLGGPMDRTWSSARNWSYTHTHTQIILVTRRAWFWSGEL